MTGKVLLEILLLWTNRGSFAPGTALIPRVDEG